jgi:RimJ/RimL family protein N-acetyltransferase
VIKIMINILVISNLGLLIGTTEKVILAYWLAIKIIGVKGFDTESIKLVVEYGFKVLGLNKLCAGYYVNNLGSAKAIGKCGF